MGYNKIRHLELLKRSLDCKKQNKSLDQDNPEEYSELIQYQIIVYDHICWNHRKEFVLLMENFVNDLLDLEQFEIPFSLLWCKTMKEYEIFEIDLKRIENFQLSPESDKFGSYITCVFRKFEELEDKYCTQQEVKDYVRYILRQIKSSTLS